MNEGLKACDTCNELCDLFFELSMEDMKRCRLSLSSGRGEIMMPLVGRMFGLSDEMLYMSLCTRIGEPNLDRDGADHVGSFNDVARAAYHTWSSCDEEQDRTLFVMILNAACFCVNERANRSDRMFYYFGTTNSNRLNSSCSDMTFTASIYLPEDLISGREDRLDEGGIFYLSIDKNCCHVFEDAVYQFLRLRLQHPAIPVTKNAKLGVYDNYSDTEYEKLLFDTEMNANLMFEDRPDMSAFSAMMHAMLSAHTFVPEMMQFEHSEEDAEIDEEFYAKQFASLEGIVAD